MSGQTVNGVSVFDAVPRAGQDGGMSPLDPPKHAPHPTLLAALPADYKPSWRARRAIDRALRGAAEADERRAKIDEQLDLYAAADLILEQDPSAGNPTGLVGRLTAAASWIKNHRVLLFVAFVMTVSEALIVVLQLAYYRGLPGLVVDLGGFVIRAWSMFPIVDTGFTWACGMMAAYAVNKNRGNPRRYMRCMWAFASVSVFVSASHYLTHFTDPTTALFVAGLSIATPFLWHLYVGLVKDIQSGVTVEDIKLAVRTRILHPVYSFRTDRIQPLLQSDRDVAWRYALVYTVAEFKDIFLPRLREQLEQINPASISAGGNETVPPKPKVTVKRAATPPPPADMPDEKEPETAKVTNLKLASEFGPKRAQAIAAWLNSLDGNNEEAMSFNQIDVALFGKVTKTTSQAVGLYIKRYGDPRETKTIVNQ